MDIEFARSVLGWCSLVHVGLLTVWFLVFSTAHDSMHRFHGKWFMLSAEEFDRTHYMLMGMYKLVTVLFFLVPYLVLRGLG